MFYFISITCTFPAVIWFQANNRLVSRPLNGIVLVLIGRHNRGENGGMKPVARMPSDTTAVQQARVEGTATVQRRSRTPQGKLRLLTLDALDARTAAATAAHQLVATLTADMGGEDQLSAGEKQLVQRAAMTGAIVSESAMSKGTDAVSIGRTNTAPR